MPAVSDKGALHVRMPAVPTSVFEVPAATPAALRTTALVERHDIKGTVDAAIVPTEVHSYSIAREPVIATSHYRATGLSNSQAQAKKRARPGAIDLINELQEITGQVNRMMAQVERAIDRLAIHEG